MAVGSLVSRNSACLEANYGSGDGNTVFSITPIYQFFPILFNTFPNDLSFRKGSSTLIMASSIVTGLCILKRQAYKITNQNKRDIRIR
jgi:hypothetical protein